MKKYFVLIFSIAVIYSCSKFTNEDDNKNLLVSNENIDATAELDRLKELPDLTSSVSQSIQTDGFGFTLAEMELVGTLHNTYAIAINNSMDLTCTNCLELFNTELKDLYRAELTALGEEDLSSVNDLVEQSSIIAVGLKEVDGGLYQWNPNALSTEGFVAYNQIIDVINTAENVSKAISQINNLIIDFTSANFTTYELELLIISAEVAKNSFELWASTDIGGIGLFGQLNGGESAYDSRWCWRCALAGDIAGVTSYFVGLSVVGVISAAAIPGANVVLAAGAATAAVAGSIIGGSGITNQP